MYNRKNLYLCQFPLPSTVTGLPGALKSNPPKTEMREVEHLVQHLRTNEVKLGLELTYFSQASLPILLLKFHKFNFLSKEAEWIGK